MVQLPPAQLESNVPSRSHYYHPADPFALSIHAGLRVNRRSSINSVDDITPHKLQRMRLNHHPHLLSPHYKLKSPEPPSLESFELPYVTSPVPYNRTIGEQTTPVRPPLRRETRPWHFESSHTEVQEPTSLKVLIWTFLFFTLPRQIYLHCLLRIPYMYFSRVIQIFEDAQMTLEEIKEMALEVSEEEHSPNLHHKRSYSYSTPRSYYHLKKTWQRFIDSLMREWKTLNIVSALMLYGILGIFQIEGADRDPITRYAAFCSSICALLSLMYGCIFIIRFASMRKVTRACEWAVAMLAFIHKREFPRTTVEGVDFTDCSGGAPSNVSEIWSYTDFPGEEARVHLECMGYAGTTNCVAHLVKSIIAYIVCIMALMWRVSRDNEGNIKVPMVSPHTELTLRVFTCSVLGVGLVYVALIINTMRYYGSRMDDAWRARMEEYRNEKWRCRNHQDTQHQQASTPLHNHTEKAVTEHATPGTPNVAPPSPFSSNGTGQDNGGNRESKYGSDAWRSSPHSYLGGHERMPVAEDVDAIQEVVRSSFDRQRNGALALDCNPKVVQGTVPVDILTPGHGSLRSTTSKEKVKESDVFCSRTRTEKRNPTSIVEDTNDILESASGSGVGGQPVGNICEDRVLSASDGVPALDPVYPKKLLGVGGNVPSMVEGEDTSVQSNHLLGNQRDANGPDVVGENTAYRALSSVEKPNSDIDIDTDNSSRRSINLEETRNQKLIMEIDTHHGNVNKNIPELVNFNINSDGVVSPLKLGEFEGPIEDEVQGKAQSPPGPGDQKRQHGRKRSTSRKRSVSRGRRGTT